VRPSPHLHITKGIPVGGGMAGGSADAAAALVACDAFWGTELDRTTLLALAAELGSDVPFPLMGGTAVGVGRGERLTPALARGRFTWTLALAEGGLSTPAVYAEIDRLRAVRVLPGTARRRPRHGGAAGRRRGRARPLAEQRPAAGVARAAPALLRTLDIGREHGALGAMVSGSGPTCAFLAADDEHGRPIADALLAAVACSTARVVHGPVHGARVVRRPAGSQGGR
jgi:4-diphosphocytidyl-2-C-methyl-D-erythritol kinase